MPLVTWTFVAYAAGLALGFGGVAVAAGLAAILAAVAIGRAHV